MIDLTWKKKRNKIQSNVNKMIMKTTNREDFKDFKIVPKSSRRSQSCETLPDSKTIITPEKRRVIPNNSKEFQSTLTLISPFYHKSSYNFNFYNYGQCKFVNLFTK